MEHGIDVLTASGFEELAKIYGTAIAHEMKLIKLERLIKETKDFRWHSLKWEIAWLQADFEFKYWRYETERKGVPFREYLTDYPDFISAQALMRY